MNQVFDIKRFGYLARRDLFTDWRGIGIASGAVAGALFLMVMMQVFFNGYNSMNYSSFLIQTLFIWGSISASMAFTSLHDKTRNEYYLLLPASSVEKTLVRLLSVSVATPLYIIIMLSFASVFTEAAAALFFQSSFSPLNPFQMSYLRVLAHVVILQSVFFLGAAWFKKAHFIKTVLTVILFSIIIGILIAIVSRFVFSSWFEGSDSPGMVYFDFDNLMTSRFSTLTKTLEVIGKVLFYGLLAPFCWFVAWLRVKGTQSSDGV